MRIRVVKFKYRDFLTVMLFLTSIGLGAPTQASSDFDRMGVWPNYQYFTQLERSGLLLLGADKQPLLSQASHTAFIPASTTKLLTALLALRHWGADYRFKTDFYLIDESQVLANQNSVGQSLLIKGYGDPFLVSEELAIMAANLAKKLKSKGVFRLEGLYVDASYFEKVLNMPGAGRSDNPYDAVPSALAANFNTVYLRKTHKGVESAESQTPLTATARAIAKGVKGFKKTATGLKKRVNLGGNPGDSQRYFMELFSVFLAREGIELEGEIAWRTQSEQAQKQPPLYRHENSKTLAEIVKPMMKYSTNFVANQLALSLSADIQGGAATAKKVEVTYQALLSDLFDWQNFHIEEGAGLSHHNQLSPRQLIDVLAAFEPWRYLLPEVEPGVFAKSGTLNGVSTLAGYIQSGSDWLPFALMMNQKVPYRFRNKLAQELSERYRPIGK